MTRQTNDTLNVIRVSQSQEAGHTISITSNGIPYSHCHNSKLCNNELGQLGRSGDPNVMLPIVLRDSHCHSPQSSVIDRDTTGSTWNASPVAAYYAYTGGFSSSGHSAIIDLHGDIWLAGCDRWQQLGLGSSQGGSTGYTWKGGRLWQETFQKNTHILELVRTLDPSLGRNSTSDILARKKESLSSSTTTLSKQWIRDVALGGDHSVILSSNRKDVIVFGKGGEGQLGLTSKPWVSSPAKSKKLSSSLPDIAAVCAFRHCSFTLDDHGGVKKVAGKCSIQTKEFNKALQLCMKRAVEDGLITTGSS